MSRHGRLHLAIGLASALFALSACAKSPTGFQTVNDPESGARNPAGVCSLSAPTAYHAAPRIVLCDPQ
jgi:hypothetical protein